MEPVAGPLIVSAPEPVNVSFICQTNPRCRTFLRGVNILRVVLQAAGCKRFQFLAPSDTSKGTWTGSLRDVSLGLANITATGFGITEVRLRHLKHSVPLPYGRRVFLLKREALDEIQRYRWWVAYDLLVWLCIVLIAVVLKLQNYLLARKQSLVQVYFFYLLILITFPAILTNYRFVTTNPPFSSFSGFTKSIAAKKIVWIVPRLDIAILNRIKRAKSGALFRMRSALSKNPVYDAGSHEAVFKEIAASKKAVTYVPLAFLAQPASITSGKLIILPDSESTDVYFTAYFSKQSYKRIHVVDNVLGQIMDTGIWGKLFGNSRFGPYYKSHFSTSSTAKGSFTFAELQIMFWLFSTNVMASLLVLITEIVKLQ